VVFPESIDDVARLVREANAHGLALVPSGGRTGLSGGAVAGHGEMVVSFDRMNAVLDFEPADALVRCQAGLVTQALQTFARNRGFTTRWILPPRAPARSAATSPPMPAASR
jgi:FAD/FMN-containing dehydrogenase